MNFFLTNLFLKDATAGTYQRMLEAARLKKQGGIVQQPQQSQPPERRVKTEVPVARPSSLRKDPNPNIVSTSQDVFSDNNDLPFDDDMYDHLKFVISKFTARMKSPTVLSQEELSKLEYSISAIIQDSAEMDGRGQGGAYVPEIVSSPYETTIAATTPSKATLFVPEKVEDVDDDPVDVTDKLGGWHKAVQDEDGKDNPFNALFKGATSTWDIPGKENMTTEEYYKAINKRISLGKEMRKGQPQGGRASDDYLESLSKKRS